MKKIALGTKLTSAYKTVAGKAKEDGQKAMTGSKDKLTRVPFMLKGAMSIREFSKKVIEGKK